MNKPLLSILLGFFISSSLWSNPIVLDLTEQGTSGSIDGVLFVQAACVSGTGRYVDFVQLRASETERGYNTSARPLEFDEGSSPNFNRDVTLSELSVTDLNGQQYVVFGLDLNETGSHPCISLDTLEIYVSATGERTNYPYLGTLVYSMDSSDVDNTVLMDSSLSAGSGYADITVLVPTSILSGFSLDSYLYLYSEFGGYGPAWTTSDGAEQWGISRDGPRYVPEARSIYMFSLAFVFVIGLKRASRTTERKKL